MLLFMLVAAHDKDTTSKLDARLRAVPLTCAAPVREDQPWNETVMYKEVMSWGYANSDPGLRHFLFDCGLTAADVDVACGKVLRRNV